MTGVKILQKRPSDLSVEDTMLYECRHTIPPEGNLRLRWFHNSFFDLDIWIHTDGSVEQFLLCYNKPLDPHAISWRSGGRYMHYRIDDGEGRPGKHKSTPLLLPNGKVDVIPLAVRFFEESREMQPSIAAFVHEKLLAFPSHHSL